MGIILMRTAYMVRAPTEDKTEQMLCRPPLNKRRLFSFQDKMEVFEYGIFHFCYWYA